MKKINYSKYHKVLRDNFIDKLDNDSLALVYSGREVMQDRENPYPFSVNSNYYYLTHLDEPDGLYAVYKDDEGQVSEMLFIPENIPERVRWLGETYSPEKAKEISLIDQIYMNSEIPNILGNIDFKRIYYPLEQVENQRFELEQIDLDFDDVVDSTPLLDRLRLIKSEDEVEEIRKAYLLTREALLECVKNIEPGKREYELAADFEHVIKGAGAELAFDSIVAAGKNAVKLHYPQQRDTLEKDDLVLFDVGASLNGYASDVSRTFPVSGTFSELQRKFYQAVLNTEKAMIELYTSGTKLKDIQEATKKKLTEELKEAGIELPEGGIDSWYYHGIGHSLGIDTHDTNNRDLVLEDGMVITCEPGLYADEYGIGIRIEDDILVNKENPVVLTDAIPKEIDEVEALFY